MVTKDGGRGVDSEAGAGCARLGSRKRALNTSQVLTRWSSVSNGRHWLPLSVSAWAGRLAAEVKAVGTATAHLSRKPPIRNQSANLSIQ